MNGQKVSVTKPAPPARSRAAGFALMEQMVAGVAAAAVLLPLVALFYASNSALDTMDHRLESNRQARQIMWVFGEGGQNPQSGPGDDGTDNVYGLHSRNEEFGGKDILDDYQLVLTNNGLTISGDGMAPFTINCRGKDDPVGECKDDNDDVTINGWVDHKETKFEEKDRSVKDRTVELNLYVVNAILAKNEKARQRWQNERYRNVYTLNREIDDP